MISTILLFFSVVKVMMNPWLILVFIALFIVYYFAKDAFNNSKFGKKMKINRDKIKIEDAKKLKKIKSFRSLSYTYVSSRVSTLYFDENNIKIYLQLLYQDYCINFR